MNAKYKDYKSNLDKMYGNWVEGGNGTIWYLDNKKNIYPGTENWKLYRVLEKNGDLGWVLTDGEKIIGHSEDGTEGTAGYELVNKMFLLLIKYDPS